MKTHILGAFELAQIMAFERNVDELYTPEVASHLHQLIQAILQSGTLTEVVCRELRLLLPCMLPQEQKATGQKETQSSKQEEDDWLDWSEQVSKHYQQRQARLAELHELLHMLQTLQFHKEKARCSILPPAKSHRRDY